jgi:hypothetical protein
VGSVGYIEVLLFWSVLGGVVSGFIWQSKGGSFGAGFLLGALLGIIGIILVAVMTPDKNQAQRVPLAVALRECPHCKTPIRRDASVCPQCQRESEAWTFHKDKWWVRRSEGWYWRDEQADKWNLVTNEEAEAQKASRAQEASQKAID